MRNAKAVLADGGRRGSGSWPPTGEDTYETQHRPHVRHPRRQALAPNPLIFPTLQSNHDSLTAINRSMDAAAVRLCHLMCAGRWPRGNQLMETVMIRPVTRVAAAIDPRLAPVQRCAFWASGFFEGVACRIAASQFG
jgi:hypothetical protein